ncbi:MAG: ornithine carbamoyltransferase [Thermoleophilia bacterium]|nr:ornithine carbamoyltransferase [Thermoleophilia bacterium]
MVRHFLKIADLSPDEILSLVKNARANKGELSTRLAHKCLGMIFAKPSTRTRASFTAGVYQLGGHVMFISEREMQLGRGETIEDTARVLSGYLDGVVIRTYRQDDVEKFASAAEVPVINGLTDERHPCQALSDLMTMSEQADDLAKTKVVYLGDGNNVAVSLMNGCASVGAAITVCTPEDLAPPQWAVREAEALAAVSGSRVSVTSDPQTAVEGADFVYTDVWFSMGQQKNSEKRRQLDPYRIDGALLAKARPDAKVMHCLPAHRGEEIAAEVMDGPQSIVFAQAENRLYAQKELLKFLLADGQR